MEDKISEDTILAVPSTEYPFSFLLIPLMLVLAVPQFNNSLKEYVLYPSNPASSTKLNKNVYISQRTMWNCHCITNVRTLYYQPSAPNLPLL